MYLDDPKIIPHLAQNTHFLILITDKGLDKSYITFKNAIPIPLSEKGTHDIETVRQLETLTRTKQSAAQTFIIEQADQLTLPAQNAFLKLLEEPNDNISFVFLSASPQSFLPTVLSRAKIFYLRSPDSTPPNPAILAQARTLVSGHKKDLLPLANTLSKDRPRALKITQTAISELYRSQLTKPTPTFLAKLEKLLALEKALKNNGHIKLHIANMI